MPTMIPLQSSTIAAVGYDPAATALHVQFLSGATYVYRPVPLHHYAGILGAESPGSYHGRFIKGQYAWTAAGDAKPAVLDLGNYTLDERAGFAPKPEPTVDPCDTCGAPATVFASAPGSDETAGQWCDAHLPSAA